MGESNVRFIGQKELGTSKQEAEVRGAEEGNKAVSESTLRQSFKVEYQYQVKFTYGLFESQNRTLLDAVNGLGNQPAKIIAIIDDQVASRHATLLADIQRYADYHSDLLNLAAEPLLIPGGELCKNSDSYVDSIRRLISDAGICRHSYVLAIGGGALLDAVGYAAATAHRGVRLLRVPTTVLSQNDSGVGVKNGINAFGKKNFLGTFAPPYAVLNDYAFLESLGDRDWRSGIAEAVKVSLIKDPEFFNFIDENTAALKAREPAPMRRLIFRCAELHMNHIGTGGDPFEFGSSRPLDFGHWAAHRLEHLTRYRLRHGEAVAIGIALDCVYANLIGLLSSRAMQRILQVLSGLGFNLWVDELGLASEDGSLEVIKGLEEFREHLGGELTFMLLNDIGHGVNAHSYEEQFYVKAIDYIRFRFKP